MSKNGQSTALQQRQAKRKVKHRLVVHPVLFAIFPSLFLLAKNMDQFELSVAVVPTLTAACLALSIWWLLSLVLKSKTRAALIVSLFFLLFLSYEAFYMEIRPIALSAGLARIGTRRYLLATSGMVFAAGTYLLVRTRRELDTVTHIVNVASACLVAISLVNITAYEFKARAAEWGGGEVASMVVTPPASSDSTSFPDIYYIIVDGYARADILEEIYHYDNTEFLDHLRSKGFFVARESRANYSQTALSLASSLNLQYLDALAERLGPHYSRRGPLTKMIHNNEVFRFLREAGYKIVAFPSGYSEADPRSADVYLAPRWSPDEFQMTVIGMTPIPWVLDQLGLYDEYSLHRDRILYTFDHLAEFSQLEAPVFVFAHILAPHPPFVFGPNGEEITPDYRYRLADGDRFIVERRLSREEYRPAYRDQLVFVNSRLEQALDVILSQSEDPPVIVVQSDHGPGSLLYVEDPEKSYLKERLGILNAYYLPDTGGAQLYDGITPVNTFRVVFNQYFGTDLELLRDEVYFATRSHPYEFIDVTDEVDAEVGEDWE
jgi:hypothetical protein